MAGQPPQETMTNPPTRFAATPAQRSPAACAQRSAATPQERSPAAPPKRCASTLASWSATIVRALDARGLGGAAIAVRAGVDPAMLTDAEARVPRAALTRL